MGSESINLSEGWSQFYGPNLGYMLEMYDLYESSPEEVDEDIVQFFKTWGPYEEKTSAQAPSQTAQGSAEQYTTAVNAMRLAESIRRNGHLMADIVPVKMNEPKDIFQLEEFDLSEEELKKVPAELLSPHNHSSLSNGLEAVQHLKETYTKRLAFEFNQVHDINERRWLFQQVESGDYLPSLTNDMRVKLLERLNQVEGFEHFIHKTFKGQKRFSVEGLDSMIPLLDEAVTEAVEDGTEHVMIGMAHRGRLNVLAHVLGKPYELIFSEFHDAPNKDLVPSEGSVGINYGWTGDVKYHLGADREIHEESTDTTVTLANNPSHLEFVNPVVEGLARAAQDDRDGAGTPKQDHNRALPILIHGDAAFPGQGIVAETLNLSRLDGYNTGGTIHVIANNLIGFTTVSTDSRSTTYASDPAKGYEVPVIHVNADDVEACVSAMHLAYLYRKEFHKDIVIDLIGYRRYGHNEMDEPLATQPQLYKKVKEHPTVFHIYGEELVKEKVIEEETFSSMRDSFMEKLTDFFEEIKGNKRDHIDNDMNPPEYVEDRLEGIESAISKESLLDINRQLLEYPEDFTIFPKLEKILNRRLDAAEKDDRIDWGHAEALAFATIITDGTPIRLTGQDSERGTFSQRHLVLHDYEKNGEYNPLHGLKDANATFTVHNSPLSEAACVGFEYGYNVHSPETLTIWEAQYGDFSNGAQVLFDQFISSGRAKWGQKSGLVLLLPHGYEGQGPEHSSGRMERFLTLAAENNWHVANLTRASQYFHLLRRQALTLTKDEVRPLVLMAPKSLLRNESVASTLASFTEGTFEPVLPVEGLGTSPEKIKKVVFASGKVAVDLEEKLQETGDYPEWLHILKVEELYPFPRKHIEEILEGADNIEEYMWVQEEPQNMGAWHYIYPYLRSLSGGELPVHFAGRRRRSSTAEGDPKVHKLEQARIIEEALNRDVEGSNE
ncbi:2-oxoglutarate dehydrogenase E1 component [Alkalicoccus urumqiensis]|uniref:2-oxoglutarate dehydrogenase E1 component n=1 Tax=Alkalicoccus urumqiensis TaxID=1548213 RepID=A0A2P6MKT5_ALKUR|nr:2-oxoglutarate dehydrogenase E1 component [Alkalicoccus urumqiensis]PRO66889.1 2-oxoglutarate dehydrogenase E1 component [Alkalicoccus urumqiensis]